jgi:hypothetical protein
MAALIDHLWQSILVFVLLQLCVCAVRRHSASVRLAMWRIAALKFLVPFQLLAIFGGWLGLPVRHSADPVPAFLTSSIAAAAPLLSPASARGVSGFAAVACLVALFIAAVACGRWALPRLRFERWRVARERLRAQRNPDDTAPGLGFIRGLVFTALTVCGVLFPMLAGAVEDREWRIELLRENARSLRDARIDMKPAAFGMGGRLRVSADPQGVSIRNATIRDLTALSYGVRPFFVRGDHFYEAGEQDWLIAARYDIRITGRIREPAEFDPYALRIPITRMLADRHGLEIYIDSECQPPCGRYGMAIPKDAM